MSYFRDPWRVCTRVRVRMCRRMGARVWVRVCARVRACRRACVRGCVDSVTTLWLATAWAQSVRLCWPVRLSASVRLLVRLSVRTRDGRSDRESALDIAGTMESTVSAAVFVLLC